VDAPSTGLTRVTIASPQRRVDLALPDGVPLAELLPEVLDRAGVSLADDGERHGGWVLRRADGTALSSTKDLSAQGVPDGAVLHLVPARQEWPELEYDDVVEVIAAGARRTGSAWTGRATRIGALIVAGLALTAGLWAVLRSGPPWTVAALVALGVAATLLLAGVTFSRAYGDAPAGTVLAAYAMPYAFLGGLLLLAGHLSLHQLRPWHLLDGCAALVLAGTAGAIGTAYDLRVFVSAVTAGVLGIAGCLLALATTSTGAAAVVLAVLATGVVGLPLLAIRLGRLPLPLVTLPAVTLPVVTLPSVGLPAPVPVPDVPPARVFAAVARTDEILTGLLLGVAGTAAGASAILAARTGVAGWLLVLVVAVTLLLRARLFVSVRHRTPLLAAGAAGLVVLVASQVATHPARTNLLVVAGLVVVALGIAGAGTRYAVRSPSVYASRAADLLDTLCAISVVPVACAVLNLYSLAAGLIH
jgi:type VII secretion integral membrane protein EccD